MERRREMERERERMGVKRWRERERVCASLEALAVRKMNVRLEESPVASRNLLGGMSVKRLACHCIRHLINLYVR